MTVLVSEEITGVCMIHLIARLCSGLFILLFAFLLTGAGREGCLGQKNICTFISCMYF